MEKSFTTTNTLLTKRIMRRIYFVWAIRMMLSPVVLKSLIAVLFFWRSTAFVSYANVFANAPQFWDIPRNVQFFRSAAMHAETTTLLLVFGTIVLAAWVCMDMLSRKSHAWF